MSKIGIWVLEKGWLRIRFREEIEPDAVIETYHDVRSATRAIRKFTHIIEKHGRGRGPRFDELARLRQLKESASQLLDAVRFNSLDPKQKYQYESLLSAQVLEELFDARDRAKEEAGGLLLEAAALEDSKGRFNPAVIIGRISAALGQIDLRLGEVQGLLPYSVTRREILNNFLEFIEYHRRRSLNKVGRAIYLVQARGPKEILRKTCNDAIYSAYRFWLSPYYTIYLEVVTYLKKARESYVSGDMDEALDNLLLARHFLANEVGRD